jgi:glycosyltransferase involved in cell wall biosynthesis
MRILISAVSSARSPSGICRHAASLARSLAEARQSEHVTLLLGPWQASYFQHAFGLRHTKLHVVTVDVRSNSFDRNLWYYRTLPDLAREHSADAVHLSFPVPLHRERFSCPVLMSLHDLYPYDVPGNFGAARVLFNRAFLRQCLRESDAVVCSSDFTRGRLKSVDPQAWRKAIRIHQGVSIDPQCSRMPSIPEINGRAFLLAVAQHRRNKNLALLVSAFARFRDRDESNRRMRLVIIGAEGPETRTLRELIKRNSLQQQVVFQNALPDAELCWLYRRCALLIAPSSIEGFGLPVAEALHCGSRVLCSDIPIFREIGGSRCSYFPLAQDNPAAGLTDAIHSALRAPVVGTPAINRFSPATIAQQHIAVYSRLIAGDHQPLVEPGSTPYAEYAS